MNPWKVVKDATQTIYLVMVPSILLYLSPGRWRHHGLCEYRSQSNWFGSRVDQILWSKSVNRSKFHASNSTQEKRWYCGIRGIISMSKIQEI